MGIRSYKNLPRLLVSGSMCSDPCKAYGDPARKNAKQQRQDRAAVVLQVVRDLCEKGGYPGRKKVDAALRIHGAALIRPEYMQVYPVALLDNSE